MNQSQVISNYVSRKINRRTASVEWHARNIYCEGRVIYSYGSHFPMAYYLGQRRGEDCYLLNGDRYSSTTSGHQADVRQHCKGFTIPFSALQAAGVSPSSIALENLVEVTPDVRVELTRATKDDPWQMMDGNTFQKPRIGEVVSYGDQPDGRQIGYFHAVGAALLRVAGRDLLCTADEGTYCIMELSRRCASVISAFESLKPSPVRNAEQAGMMIVRQGEWYFIPADAPEGRSKARQITLPRRDERGNRHVVRALASFNATVFHCIGNVYHRNPFGQRTGQHRTVKLATWHTAHLNTEKASWTAGGKVD